MSLRTDWKKVCERERDQLVTACSPRSEVRILHDSRKACLKARVKHFHTSLHIQQWRYSTSSVSYCTNLVHASTMSLSVHQTIITVEGAFMFLHICFLRNLD